MSPAGSCFTVLREFSSTPSIWWAPRTRSVCSIHTGCVGRNQGAAGARLDGACGDAVTDESDSTTNCSTSVPRRQRAPSFSHRHERIPRASIDSLQLDGGTDHGGRRLRGGRADAYRARRAVRAPGQRRRGRVPVHPRWFAWSGTAPPLVHALLVTIVRRLSGTCCVEARAVSSHKGAEGGKAMNYSTKDLTSSARFDAAILSRGHDGASGTGAQPPAIAA